MTVFFVVDLKTEYNALLVLIFWDGKSVTVHPADSQPFETNMIQARYYDDHVGYITLQGFNDEGQPTRISVQKAIEVGAETVHQDSARLGLANFLPEADFLAEGNNGPVLSLDKVRAAPAELEDHQPQVKDPLEEINVGTADDPRPLFISALLPQQMKDELRALLTEFKDCFAWSYHEMPGLDRTLVEHELRIKPGCKPFRQPPRRFSTEKNGALRICINFRNLNLATPKDEYIMPISDLLIDAAANHAILSFMDGHAGYNQIFIAEADVHKTAFRCPGALGTYEWVVMPFGLKNAGTTYQRAMNTIFHDLIGTIVEVYIDDVVIKSKQRRTHVDDLRQAFLRMRQHNLKMNPAKCAFGVSAGNFLGFLVHHRGIEVDENKACAIISAPPPTTKKQLQSLLGKMKAFSTLLKLKDSDTFAWTNEH
ncbi:hypothetical protein PS2_014761 [Malus domestica]